MTSPDTPSDRSTRTSQPLYRSKAFQGGQTAYRHIEPLAVTSLVLGGLSFLPMFGWPLIVLPIAGAICSLIGLRQIANFPGERTGRGMALAGLVLSIVLGLTGVLFYALFVVHGAPIGYSAVTFAQMQPQREEGKDISKDIHEEIRKEIPKDIVDLNDKFIYIKGYMYPGRRSMGIKEFVLVPTQAHCKFCQRDLASTEMIKVTMTGDELADYSVHLVGIGGKLKINWDQVPRKVGGMPYEIEADVFRE